MGFLRKVGKKIKKGVKKLFGSKFGKILGGIGLAMLFWGGASSLFNGQGWWKGVGDTLKSMNPFAKSDLTSAVETVGAEATKTATTTSTAVGTGAETLKSEALAGATESVTTGIGSSSTRTLTDIPFSELDVGQKLAKAGVETVEFFTPSKDFVADVTKGALTSLAVQAAQGKQEIPFQAGQVQPNIGGSGEPPQSMILAEVKNQIPQLNNVNTFQDLSRNTFYGTLDPHFLAQFARG